MSGNLSGTDPAFHRQDEPSLPSQPAHHAADNHRRRIRAALSGTDLRADVQGGGLLLERGVQGVLGYNKLWVQTFRKS